MIEPDEFIFVNNLKEICADRFRNYCFHIICLSGAASFEIGTRKVSMHSDDMMIKSSAGPILNLTCSDDIRIEGLLISWDYFKRNTPKSKYLIRGYLESAINPVFHGDEDGVELIHHDFVEIRNRIKRSKNPFFDDVLRRVVHVMVFDFYDLLISLHSEFDVGQSRQVSILRQFIDMLRTGLYRHERTVSYYATKMFITPKYLSEACLGASGYNASYWISFFTSDAILNELRYSDKTFQQISDEFNFSSVSYFSRYVKANLHKSPTELRSEAKNGEQ